MNQQTRVEIDLLPELSSDSSDNNQQTKHQDTKKPMMRNRQVKSLTSKKPPPIGVSNRYSSVNHENTFNIADNLTRDQLESWSDSNTGFDNMMSSPSGRAVFGMYLVQEFSCDNLQFWRECQKLKQIKNDNEFTTKAKEIFNIFLEKASPREVDKNIKICFESL